MTQKEIIQGLESIENRAIDFPYMTASDWVAIGAAKRHLENSLEVKEVDSTDAFIEKATEWLKENKDHPLIGCEDICLSGYLTDEFIEDFKNYMKGE